jgi:thiosulfate reductase cytochrome b subunit
MNEPENDLTNDPHVLKAAAAMTVTAALLAAAFSYWAVSSYFDQQYRREINQQIRESNEQSRRLTEALTQSWDSVDSMEISE